MNYNDENSYHYSGNDPLPHDDYVPRQHTPQQEQSSQQSHYEENRQTTPPQQPYSDKIAPKKPGKKFFQRAGTKVAALLVACAFVGGLSGMGGALLADNIGRKTTIHESQRPVAEVNIQKVDGQKLMTPAEVYASTVNSVVSINSSVTTNVFGQTVESASSGSGFLITEDGYIVTNHHVVEGVSKVEVTLYNGEKYPAKIVGGDSDYDLAVLKIDGKGLQPVTLGNSADVNVGDTVLAIGNPLGELTFSQSQGSVSSTNRAINVAGIPFNMIQVDASINPGNSGGPLMNLYGEVIGIVSAKYSSYADTAVEGLGFAIPISDVRAMITDIMENGQVTGKPYLGITVGTMTPQMAAQYQLDVKDGVFVYSVEKDGPCAAAGLRLGDVITKMDDRELKNMEDLNAAKKGHKAGDTVELTYFREGATHTTKLTFGEQPETPPKAEESNLQQFQNGQNVPDNGDIFDFYEQFFGRG